MELIEGLIIISIVIGSFITFSFVYRHATLTGKKGAKKSLDKEMEDTAVAIITNLKAELKRVQGQAARYKALYENQEFEEDEEGTENTPAITREHIKQILPQMGINENATKLLDNPALAPMVDDWLKSKKNQKTLIQIAQSYAQSKDTNSGDSQNVFQTV